MITETVISMQEHSEINFLFMDENKYGVFFKKTLQASKYSAAQMARELRINPQRITHWQNRGVAAKYAQSVSKMLGVRPAQISDLKGSARGAELNANTALAVEEDVQLYNALTPEKQLAAVLAIADSATPVDAITYAEYFLARAKAGLREK